MPIVACPTRTRRAGVIASALALLTVACQGTTTPPPSQSAAASSSPSGAAMASCPADGDAPAAHWWDGRVFYEVFVRSFADSDG
ncbi:MAG TPA: hypothetical protein VKA85_10065, partial [Candidatus Limnocylindrales bacterium]|nr:hypothetical protein [Candidatus Limnocylindrales bacterium]